MSTPDINEPNPEVFETLIENLLKVIKEHDLIGQFYVCVSGDGYVKVGDHRLTEILRETDLTALGMGDPELPPTFTIAIDRQENGVFSVEIGDSLDAIAQAQHQEEAEQNLMNHVNLFFQNSSLTFHEDGNVTGTGMGHHLAKSIRQSLSDPSLKEAMENPLIQKPYTVFLTSVRWNKAIAQVMAKTSIH